MSGRTLALHVPHRSRREGCRWVVPVSAVVTARLRSVVGTVTVLEGRRQVSVPVRAGLAFAGREVVRPIGGGLKAGEQVVIGLAG